MAKISVKFNPSALEGMEGKIFYRISHCGRNVRPVDVDILSTGLICTILPVALFIIIFFEEPQDH